MPNNPTILQVPLQDVFDNPYQPRKDYNPEGIQELAADIELRGGLIQTPVARLLGETAKGVQLAFGHRRFRAYQLLHELQPADPRWAHFPVEIRQLSNEQMAEYAWSENSARADLSAIEEAQFIDRTMRLMGWTQEQAAVRLNMSRPALANKLRLLKLPQDLQAKVTAGELSERQASAILPAVTLPPEAIENANDMARYNLRDLDTLIKQGASSDILRNKAERIVETTTADLKHATFDPADALDPAPNVQFRQRSCTGCSMRLSGDRCADVQCYSAKTDLGINLKVANAAKVAGLPGVTYADYKDAGGYSNSKIIAFYHSDTASLGIAKEKRCPNLHVCWDAYGGGSYLHPDGDEHISYACYAGGKVHKCKCMEEHRAAVNADANARDAERKRQLQIVYDETAKTIVDAFEAGQLGAFKALLRVTRGYAADGDKVIGLTDRAKVLRLLAKAIIDFWPENPDPEHARKNWQAELRKYGITGPDDERLAAIAAAAKSFERIDTWLTTIGVIYPKIEAIHGNQDNLRRLRGEAMALQNHAPHQPDEADRLLTRITEAEMLLDDLEPVVARWDGRGFGVMADLTAGGIPKETFLAALAQASDDALDYAALYLSDTLTMNDPRLDAIRQELNRRGCAIPIARPAEEIPQL